MNKQQIKQLETISQSINDIIKLCKKQSKSPKHYLRDRKLKWNIQTLNSCCTEMNDFNNYLLNNNFKNI